MSKTDYLDRLAFITQEIGSLATALESDPIPNTSAEQTYRTVWGLRGFAGHLVSDKSLWLEVGVKINYANEERSTHD